MTTDNPNPHNRKWLNILVGLGVLMLAGLSVYLGLLLRESQTELNGAVESLDFLLARSETLNSDLTAAQTEVANLQAEIAFLEDEAAQIEAEKLDVETQAQLYKSQRYYLADVLAWFGRNYGLVDVEHMVRTYQMSTGQGLPETCEVSPFDRYVRWAATNSQMFVVTPDKMGWTMFTNWSVRENVVFGPDHVPDDVGYVGSRGYEFRYPLVVGVFPEAEVHTTINVFDFEVEPITDFADAAVVTLDCGINGYFTTSPIDSSSIIRFVIGDYEINIKLKYFSDFVKARFFLTQAANIVIGELTNGW